MRVNIQHREVREGLILKKTFVVVDTTITFSEEEKQVIKENKMRDDVLYQTIPANAREDRDPAIYYPRVRDFLNGTHSFYTASNLDAKQYEAELTICLRGLKQFIEDGAESGESKSFEL